MSDGTRTELRTKICGLTREADIRAAVDAGTDLVGFVFADSPRRISPERAGQVARCAPSSVLRVAVFHYPSRAELLEVLGAFSADLVQAEPTEEVRAAVPPGTLLPVFHDGPEVVERALEYWEAHPEAPALLVEGAGRGGRGMRADWTRVAEVARHARVLLAGGLDPDVVAEAVRTVEPWGVDVSSGVEADGPGLKDPDLIRRFIERARGGAST